MEILIQNVSVEEINSALLRIKRQIKDDAAQLETRVLEIVDNSKTTTITNENEYDDSRIKKEITNIYNVQADLSDKVAKNTESISDNAKEIQNLTQALSLISVFYDETTNELTYSDAYGNINIFRLRDTTYTFEWDDGVITITDSDGDITEIDLDARYYTKSDIQSLILDLIPTQASVSNQLADKDFVNSSIETATATFRGTFDNLQDLLSAYGDKNDYAYLKTLDSTSGIYSFDKYTYGTNGWEYAYTINSSGFTAEQLAAINSGITAGLVSKITDVHDSTITVCQGTTCVGSFTLNRANDYTLSLCSGGSDLCRCYDTTNHNIYLLGSEGYSNSTISQVNTSERFYYNPTTGSVYACNFNADRSYYGPTSSEIWGTPPYIDFHFCNYGGDYSQRLIACCGKLNVIVNNGYCNTASTQTGTFCFCSNGILYTTATCGSTYLSSRLINATATICNESGYYRVASYFRPQCNTGGGYCQCHFLAIADVTTLFDGSVHDGTNYVAGFVGNVLEHRYTGCPAENITQVIARMGYRCNNASLCYYPTFGVASVEPRVLYKCDEGKYYLGLWFCSDTSSHCVTLEGVFQQGACLCITPIWITSCTIDGCIACSRWICCGTNSTNALTINNTSSGNTYSLTLNNNCCLYQNSCQWSDTQTIYSPAFNGYFSHCYIDCTSAVTTCCSNIYYCTYCATYDRNYNIWDVYVCQPSGHNAGYSGIFTLTFPSCVYCNQPFISLLTDANSGLEYNFLKGTQKCVNAVCNKLTVTAYNRNSNTPVCGSLFHIQVPGVVTNPACCWMPVTTDNSSGIWKYKDTKTLTTASCCCLYGVFIHTENAICGPLTGMVKLKSSCSCNTANICFTVTNTKCKTFHATATPALDANSCLVLQPYMYYECTCDSNYWLIFATDPANTGERISADLWIENTGLGNNINGISLFCEFSTISFDANWNAYYVDTTIDSGSTTINNLSTCHIITNCMSTSSAKEKKKNIMPYTDSALSVIRDTDVVSYNYKNEKDSALAHIGFIANNTNKLLAGENNDQMRVNDTVGLLLKAVQELDERTNKKRRITKWFSKKK